MTPWEFKWLVGYYARTMAFARECADPPYTGAVTALASAASLRRQQTHVNGSRAPP